MTGWKNHFAANDFVSGKAMIFSGGGFLIAYGVSCDRFSDVPCQSFSFPLISPELQTYMNKPVTRCGQTRGLHSN